MRLWFPEPLRHEDPVVAGVLPAASFDKAEPRIKRDIFGHRFMRIEPQLHEPEPARFGFGERDELPPETLALTVRPYRDVVEQEMIRLHQQHDNRGDRRI